MPSALIEIRRQYPKAREVALKRLSTLFMQR